MKIIKIAKPGEIMNQPKRNPTTKKLDSQIFLEKKDPQHADESPKEKQKKNKCTVCDLKQAKKKEDYEYNPWAVCHTTVDKDKDPEKYERCVKKVKKDQKED